MGLVERLERREYKNRVPLVTTESIFRHVIVTTDGKEHVFRNFASAKLFRTQAEKEGTFVGYEMRTIGFNRTPWTGNIREEEL